MKLKEHFLINKKKVFSSKFDSEQHLLDVENQAREPNFESFHDPTILGL